MPSRLNPFRRLNLGDTLPVISALPSRRESDSRPVPPPGAVPPVHLTSQVVLQGNTDQGPPQGALVNPWGVPIEISEAKFQLHSFNTEVPSGAAVTVMLALGKHEITDQPTPVFCFGSMKPIEGENTFFPSSNANSEHVFRFPKPCLLMPGEGITCSLKHTGLVAGNITATISYAGRVSQQKNPTSRIVPYVSSYASKVFTTYGAADTDASNPTTDLVNSLDTPVRVERFVGRVTYFNNGVAALGNNDGQPDMPRRLLRCRITRSDGKATVKDLTLFGNVFNYLTRTWECPHALAPDAFYTVYLDKLAAAVAVNVTDTSQAFVSMIGWREVAL